MTAIRSFASDFLLDVVSCVLHFGPFLAPLILSMIAVGWHRRKIDTRLTERIQMLEEEIDATLTPLLTRVIS